MSLQGKIVLITGSSSGIGKMAALAFAKAGAVPVLAARSVEKLQELAEQIRREYQITAPVFALDVREEDSVNRVAQAVLEQFGSVDILVNNAGFGYFKSTNEMSMEEIESMMDVNYFGLVRMTKALLPSMLARKQGHIINIASLASFFVTKTHGTYGATKYAVLGFSEGLRYELYGSGVTLSTIHPGPVDTAFFDRADRQSVPSYVKFLSPEQVAATIVRAADEKKPMYLLPKIGKLALKIKHLFPRLYDSVMVRDHS